MEGYGNQNMPNLVDQHQDSPAKAGMVGFGYVGLEKELEEHPDKVYTITLRDFSSYQHKVVSIGVVPYYTNSVLSEFEEYLA